MVGNRAPTALGDSLGLAEDTTRDVPLQASDPDGDPLTFAITAQPEHGTLSEITPGTPPTVTYTPDPDFNGVDSFTFSASDGTLSASATVELVVTPVNDPPRLSPASFTVLEDASLTRTLVATDVDGPTLLWALTSVPQHGTLSGSLPSFTYTPDADFAGEDSFGVSVGDTRGAPVSATVTITVEPINDAPRVSDTTLPVTEDTQRAVTLVANDPDDAAPTLRYVVIEEPTLGVLSGTPPSLTYTPNPDVSGTDQLVWVAIDPQDAASPEATVTLQITAVDDPPTAADIEVTTAEDRVASITLRGDDRDGDALTYEIVTPPASGTVSTGTGAQRTYTPDLDFFGTDTFTYRARGAGVGSAPATVTVTVTPVNDAPVAGDLSVSGDEEAEIAVVLPGSDPDGDPLTWTVLVPPQHGTLTGEGRERTYQGDVDFFGTDTFVVGVGDGSGAIVQATVTVEVANIDDPPFITGASLLVDEDGEVAFDVDFGDPDPSDLVGLSVKTAPQHGQIAGIGGARTYRPNANYAGPDSFEMEVTDTRTTRTATFNVTVRPVQDAPQVTCSAISLPEDEGPVALTVAGTDADGDPLSWFIAEQPAKGRIEGTLPGSAQYQPDPDAFGADSFVVAATDNLATGTARCDVTIFARPDAPVVSDVAVTVDEDEVVDVTFVAFDPDGTPVDELQWFVDVPPQLGGFDAITPPTFRYRPGANENGEDSFVVRVSDSVNAATATATITIAAVNDPPTASCEATLVPENTSVAINLSASDPENDPLTYTLVAGTSLGSLGDEWPRAVFTPQAGRFGSDMLLVNISDGRDQVQVECDITVVNFNDPPVADDQAITVAFDTPYEGRVSGSDPDGDVITFSLFTQAPNGTVSMNGRDFTYTPDPGYSGPDQFTFRVRDPRNLSDTGTVSITVLPPGNQPPVVSCAELEVEEDSSGLFTVAASDPDLDDLEITIRQLPVHGDVAGDGPTWSYTPDPDYNGLDLVLVDVSDGAVTVTARCEIVVTPINDPPVLVASSLIEVDEDDVVQQTVNAFDVDGDPLTLSIEQDAAEGTLTAQWPTFTYRPARDYNGPDSFSLTVSDNVSSATAAYNVSVLPVNDVTQVSCPVGVVVAAGTSRDLVLDVFDPDQDQTLAFSIATQPGIGSASVSSEGVVTYTAPPGANGNTSFVVRVNDGVQPVQATCSLQVTATNRPPEAASIAVTVVEDSTNNTITLTGTSDPDEEGLLFLLLTADNGSVSPLVGGLPLRVRYTPDPDFFGVDEIRFIVADTGGLTAEATVTVTVTGTPDDPVAPPLTILMVEDEPKTVDFSTLAFDPDDEPITVVSATIADTTTSLDGGALATFTPNPDKNGGLVGNYTIRDPGGRQATGFITLSVVPVPDAPRASRGTTLTATVAENGTITIPHGFVDPDNDPLSFVIDTPPASGTASLVTALFSYAPQFNRAGVFTVVGRAVDITGRSSPPVTFEITVTTIDEPPVVVGETIKTFGNEAVAGGACNPDSVPWCRQNSLLENDVDVADNNVVITSVGTFSTALGGTITVAQDGSFDYQPPLGARFTTDSFVYEVAGGLLLTDGTLEPRPARATATVSFQLQRGVWWVNGGGTGGGHSNAPSPSLAAVQAASSPGDVIVITNATSPWFPSGGVPEGSLVLKPDQQMHAGGEVPLGTEGLLQARLPGASYEPRPVLRADGVSGPVLTVTSENTVRGLRIEHDGSGDGAFLDSVVFVSGGSGDRIAELANLDVVDAAGYAFEVNTPGGVEFDAVTAVGTGSGKLDLVRAASSSTRNVRFERVADPTSPDADPPLRFTARQGVHDLAGIRWDGDERVPFDITLSPDAAVDGPYVVSLGNAAVSVASGSPVVLRLASSTKSAAVQFGNASLLGPPGGGVPALGIVAAPGATSGFPPLSLSSTGFALDRVTSVFEGVVGPGNLLSDLTLNLAGVTTPLRVDDGGEPSWAVSTLVDVDVVGSGRLVLGMTGVNVDTENTPFAIRAEGTAVVSGAVGGTLRVPDVAVSLFATDTASIDLDVTGATIVAEDGVVGTANSGASLKVDLINVDIDAVDVGVSLSGSDDVLLRSVSSNVSSITDDVAFRIDAGDDAVAILDLDQIDVSSPFGALVAATGAASVSLDATRWTVATDATSMFSATDDAQLVMDLENSAFTTPGGATPLVFERAGSGAANLDAFVDNNTINGDLVFSAFDPGSGPTPTGTLDLLVDRNNAAAYRFESSTRGGALSTDRSLRLGVDAVGTTLGASELFSVLNFRGNDNLSGGPPTIDLAGDTVERIGRGEVERP